MSDDLYDRQRRLPGIGDAGQAAIELSRAWIPSGPSAAAALAYLARAGVGRAAIERGAPPPFPHLDCFRFSAPLELARGAHLALSHLLHSVRTP